MSTDRPRRLLVVTYHFPPGAGVGGLRWAGLAKYLARAGWEVRVVSAFGDGRRAFAPDVEVHPEPPRPTTAHRYQRWRESRADRDPEKVSHQIQGFRPPPNLDPGPLRRMARKVANPLLLWPDMGRGWIRPATATARRLVREFQPTAIVSSGPPHTAHVVARMARGRSRIPWYIDLRDPWTQHEDPHRIDQWLEKTTMQAASGILVTTREFREVIRRQYPGVPVHRVPNGVDPEALPPPPSDPFAGLAAIHLGSLYMGRDPTGIINAFRRFLENFPEAADAGSALRFVGDGDHAYLGPVWEAVRDPRNRIELSPVVPREEALTLLRRSSLAVILAQGQGAMVPAKLYESVAVGVPTLVITEPGSATERESRRAGALTVAPDDVDGMTDALRSMWAGEGASPAPRDGVILDHPGLAAEVNRILNEPEASER